MTDEQLTDEERAMCIGGLGAKLLRIHDRYKARVEEMDAEARATAKRVASGVEYDGPCSQCGRGYPI